MAFCSRLRWRASLRIGSRRAADRRCWMKIRIKVNGKERDVQEVSLEGILKELGFGEAKVATAVNGEFVPVTARAERRLQQGDRLEVLAPMQGGGADARLLWCHPGKSPDAGDGSISSSGDPGRSFPRFRSLRRNRVAAAGNGVRAGLLGAGA